MSLPNKILNKKFRKFESKKLSLLKSKQEGMFFLYNYSKMCLFLNILQSKELYIIYVIV